jgi:hypothetical protein
MIVAYCGGHDGAAYRAVENDAVMVFARIVRNTFSHEHGIRILAWPKRLMDVVTWRHFTITRADIRKPLEFDPFDFYQLHEDLMLHAHKHLADTGCDI